MRHTLLAVDGNSLVHRSFHALASSGLRTRDGQPTWAVKGFLSQLAGAVERVGAHALVVGFDDHTRSVRKTEHPAYKAQRAPKPPELGQQIALTIQTLRAAGVHVVVPDGLEADDVMASAAHVAAAAGWQTVIVTSDRDSFALIDDTTRVLRVINGGIDASPLLTVDRLHTLVGVHPHQYRQFAAVRGDTSDNLDGIRGIGPKFAAKLLEVFGTIEAAMDDVDRNGGARVAAEVGRSLVAKLADEDGRAAYRRNLTVMAMRRDVPLGLDLTRPGRGLLPLDRDRVLAALDSLELVSLRAPVLGALCAEGQHAEPAPAHRASATVPAQVATLPSPVPTAAPVPVPERSAPAGLPGSRAPRPASWDDSLW